MTIVESLCPGETDCASMGQCAQLVSFKGRDLDACFGVRYSCE